MLVLLALMLPSVSRSGEDATAMVLEDAEDTAVDAAEQEPAASMGPIPPEVLQRAEEVRGLPLPQRMKAISELFLDRPYVHDPLGEGVAPDADPLARYDAFDCLTFIEEVLALALSGDPAHAAAVRRDLRYGDAPVTYASRHHFMELQWIPTALARGWLVETTADYGEAIRWERDVTADTWSRWARTARFAHPAGELPVGSMKLDILPLEAAIEVAEQIRPGSVVLTVREDRAWSPIRITHMGITIPAERPTVRHATRMQSGMRVRDHGLSWYLEHLRSYTRWPVAGIAVLEPIEQGPRLSALATAAPSP